MKWVVKGGPMYLRRCDDGSWEWIRRKDLAHVFRSLEAARSTAKECSFFGDRGREPARAVRRTRKRPEGSLRVWAVVDANGFPVGLFKQKEDAVKGAEASQRVVAFDSDPSSETRGSLPNTPFR